MDLKKLILEYSLQNAIKFNGKANPGAVIGKIFGVDPELKKQATDISKEVQAVVKDVNKMKLDEQLEKLQKLAPELLKKKKEKKERNLFEFFHINEGEKVRTAFPPGPEKYPHLGHAKAALVNFLLAKQYKGKFFLRFEDTNPELVKKEFYDVIQDNLKWLGIEWDELYYASDYMKKFYEFAEELIKDFKAYVCSCKQEVMKENRMKMVECSCRDKSPEENIEDWHKMAKHKPGSCVLRLKIDMHHQNTTMRDPTIFRIIHKEHARLGNKYRVWPTYDFQNTVMDGITEITHRIRSKEFEMRSELQQFIQKNLGLRLTQTYEIARFNLRGVPSSGRIIREMIEKKKLLGWDDPSLTTIVALRRRGFTPEGIKEFLISTGLTKSDSTLEWDDLIVHNRRVVDKESNRYFLISDPKKVVIERAPEQKLALKDHPERKERNRKFNVKDKFLVEAEDYKLFKEGKLYRLMDCLNFSKKKGKLVFDSLEHEKYKEKGEKILHWLPDDDKLVKVNVLMPNKKIVKGLAEQTVKKVKVGEIIQFERFGFCRLDEIKGKIMMFWFTHS